MEKILLTSYTEKQLIDLIIAAFKCIPDDKQTEKQGWLTRHEAAKYLKISLPTLDKLTKERKIPVHKTERKKLYNLNELNQALLNQN